MGDVYIRKQDAVEKCGEWYVEEGPEEGFIGTVSQMLDMFSPADVVPVVHARWIENKQVEKEHKLMYYKAFSCSICGKTIVSPVTNYCPDCGAKMDGEE